MRAKLKTLILLMCVVVLASTAVFVTMAYLTSNDSVENTFTVGKVKITLDEAKVDEYGNVVTGAARVKGNTYKLIPGHTYTKDPTVHLAASSEACWIFVKVDNQIADIITTTAGDGNTSYATLNDQIVANGWTKLVGTDNVYYREAKANTTDAVKDYVVFGKFTIAGEAEDTTLEAYKDKQLTVTAYAIQRDGFDTAAKAWESLCEKYN